MAAGALARGRRRGTLVFHLSVDGVVLKEDLLERIDAIVAPGLTLNSADDGWDDPSRQPSTQRRREPDSGT